MVTKPTDVARHYYSLEEYFALEHVGDARYEYWNGDIYCMSGGTPQHGIIASNVHASLAFGLRGGPCRTFTGDVAIWTPAVPPYKYPDASVVCGGPQFKTIQGMGALVNPVVIVEVLSPSTAVRDHEVKFTVYQTISTFRDYLLISQDEIRVVHYVRDGEAWQRRDITDLDDRVELDSIGCALNIRDIYDGVNFES